MKKSTLALLVIAVVVVGLVYWFEFKKPPTQKTATNPVVFHFRPEEVESVTLSHAGQTIVINRQGNGWQIAQPVDTRADSTQIGSLLNDVSLSHSSRSLTATAAQLKSFGLAPPALTLRFKLKNGQQHQLKVGDTDFTGASAYAQADQADQVLLVPASVLTDGDKPLAQLRDNSVLGISEDDVESFQLKTPVADISVARTGSGQSNWTIEKPSKARGDSTAIQQLIGDVSGAKLTKVVSETADQLGRYGLAQPALSFVVRLKSGADRTLELGRKQGDQIYARDTSRNMIFLAPANLDQQLNQNLFTLRNKKVLNSLPEDFTRIDYRSASLSFSCGVNNTGNWVMFQPASDKNKEVANWKVFNPLSSAVAKIIIDSPPASLEALMKNPAITIDLTRTDGAKKTIRISRPVGNDVYVSASDQPGLFQMAKSSLDSLSFKSASDILQ
jgi:Domain of unknown function (DUF4340)